MRRRTWIIEPPLLIAIGVGLIAYIIAAECFAIGLGLDGPLPPGTPHLEKRLWECMLLWLAAVYAVGWVQFARDRRPPSDAATWPIVVVPLAIAVWLSAAIAWRWYFDYIRSPAAYRPLVAWLDVGIPLVMVSFPLAAGLAGSYTLAKHARFWRLPFTAGRCPGCGYDLTGNVSGTCPECGESVAADPNTPREFYGRRHYWLPELSLLPNARVRYAAWIAARNAYRRTALCWITLSTFIACAVCYISAVETRLSVPFWAVFIPLAAAVAIVEVGLTRSALRRTMRRQLRESGHCDRCGQPLRDQACPACEK
jgi:hypothetical protein